MKRFGHVLLIAAILCATGTHWVMLQSVAWATMLAHNAQAGGIQEAWQKTFDGNHPCALCKTIAKGQQTEKKSELQTNLKKLELFNETISIVLNPPAHFHCLSERDAAAPLRVQSPPVPPPRILPG